MSCASEKLACLCQENETEGWGKGGERERARERQTACEYVRVSVWERESERE